MKSYTRVISSDHTGTVEVDQVPIVNDNPWIEATKNYVDDYYKSLNDKVKTTLLNDDGSQLETLYGVKPQSRLEASGPLTEEMVIKAVEKIRSGSFKSTGMASADFGPPELHPWSSKYNENLCKDDLSITKSNDGNENHSQLSKE